MALYTSPVAHGRRRPRRDHRSCLPPASPHAPLDLRPPSTVDGGVVGMGRTGCAGRGPPPPNLVPPGRQAGRQASREPPPRAGSPRRRGGRWPLRATAPRRRRRSRAGRTRPRGVAAAHTPTCRGVSKSVRRRRRVGGGARARGGAPAREADRALRLGKGRRPRAWPARGGPIGQCQTRVHEAGGACHPSLRSARAITYPSPSCCEGPSRAVREGRWQRGGGGRHPSLRSARSITHPPPSSCEGPPQAVWDGGDGNGKKSREKREEKGQSVPP